MKWFCFSFVIGISCSIIGLFFRLSIDYANSLRNQFPQLIFALPIGGIIIIFLYHHFHALGLDTNLVLESITSDKETPIKLAPIIFISTFLTHLLGGSAGRTGASLQIGGSIATLVKKIFHIEQKDYHILIMCAVATMFSVILGAPLAAVIFSMEVVHVGVFQYSALFPCFIASMVGYLCSQWIGIQSYIPTLNHVPHLDVPAISEVTIIAVVCALISALFCRFLRLSSRLYTTYAKNDYYQIACGGVIIIIFTLIIGHQQYSGAGANLIQHAFTQNMPYESFLIKITLTALTLGAAYKGGEIVPSLCIGALIGNLIASLLSMDPAFGSAIGMIAFFCSVVNCPLASIFLSLEFFGSEGLFFFFLTCAIAYALSGYSGLFKSQKIIYSKTEHQSTNINR